MNLAVAVWDLVSESIEIDTLYFIEGGVEGYVGFVTVTLGLEH